MSEAIEMTIVSVLALMIWVAVLSRAAWLVVHPHRRPVSTVAR